jgi:hypothetical protein
MNWPMGEDIVMPGEEPKNEREQMLAKLADIQSRRMDAFRSGEGKKLSTKERLALIPEATTTEALYSDVWREWGKYRCSVCGRTPAQSEAINYDCAREC